MRGSPLFRALIAFVVLLVLSWPLWRLTHARSGPVDLPVAPQSGAALKDIRLQLEFTKTPTEIVVLSLGKEIWRDPAPGLMVATELKLPYPAAGIDLQFQVSWPEESLNALRVGLTDPAGEKHEKTLWGKGHVVDVLSFP